VKRELSTKGARFEALWMLDGCQSTVPLLRDFLNFLVQNWPSLLKKLRSDKRGASPVSPKYATAVAFHAREPREPVKVNLIFQTFILKCAGR